MAITLLLLVVMVVGPPLVVGLLDSPSWLRRKAGGGGRCNPAPRKVNLLDRLVEHCAAVHERESIDGSIFIGIVFF
jgi:hypothetical protein